MRDHWATYLTTRGDLPASVFLNLGWRDLLPVREKSTLLHVSLAFNNPRPDGLSSSKEYPVLMAIEDALTARLAQSCEAAMSGRLTSRARRDFYFYAQDGFGAEAAISLAMQDFPAFHFTLRIEPDRQWLVYQSIYPSDRELQVIKNGDLLDVMKKQGDLHSIARTVDHFAYFPTSEARNRFMQQAVALGYALIRKAKVQGDFPFSINIAKTQVIEAQAIDGSVLELFDLANETGGAYDGWGCVIETEHKQ